MTNEEEEEAGSDPNNPDSDGDGVWDGDDAVPYDEDLTHPRIPVSRYAVIDLGRGMAEFINEAGQVVVVEGATTRLWSNGQNTILPGNARPAGLANNGTVFGRVEVEDEPTRAFTWSPGQTELQILPVPSGSAGDHTYAHFMTPSGEIFGETVDLEFLVSDGLRWSDGGGFPIRLVHRLLRWRNRGFIRGAI